jgi:ABC-2 type transport system permease protein
MRRIIDIALKDISQLLRDRKLVAMLLLMPIVFTVFFGFIFGSSEGETDPRLPVGVLNQDQGAMGEALLKLLQTSEAVRPVPLGDLSSDQASEQVRDGKLAAAVVVPQGFAQDAWDGRNPKFTLIVDENSMAGMTASNAISTVANRLLGAVASAGFSANAYESVREFESEEARQAYLDEGFATAADAWRDPPFSLDVELATAEETPQQDNGYSQASPGLIVQFTIWGLIMSATAMVVERQRGAMQRLLTTAVRKWEIIAGHALGIFLVTLAQTLVLLLFGQFVLGVDYLRQPLASLLVATALVLWVVSVGMLIGAISRHEHHVVMWSLIAMFLFTGLGGAWFPLESTGPAFAAIGRLMPTHYAMVGFQNIILRGLGLDSVLQPVGILITFAVAFFALAVWRFRYE